MSQLLRVIMRLVRLAFVWCLCFFASNVYANACMMRADLAMSDITIADVVVIGSIRNYEIIKDTNIREQRKNQCAEKKLTLEALCNQSNFLSDYARFEIEVETVLKGAPANFLTVTWDNSTFGEPASLGGKGERFLVALRSSETKIPPLRGPSAFVAPNPDPELLAVLQAPCAAPFIFNVPGTAASDARKVLEGKTVTEPDRNQGTKGLY